MVLRKILSLILLMVFTFPFTASVSAATSEEGKKEFMKMSEEERKILLLYFDEDELYLVSTTRSLKSITRIAENVEVVTAEDIKLMNAHTVVEALYFVTGVEVANFVGPGALGSVAIHGSDYTRVTVMLDGVPLQSATDAVELGVFPVQMIEKIEVIKGPASSTWGSSFGGVVNIITKSVGPGDHFGGTLYASGGEHETSDIRAEAYGRKGGVGLYLYGGTMNSDGLVRSHEFWENNLFSKVSIDAGNKTRIDLSFFYHKSDAEQWDYLDYDYDAYDAFMLERIYGRASLTTELSKDLSLNIYGWIYRLNDLVYENTVSSEERIWDALSHFNKEGLSANLTWQTGQHAVVAGVDLSHERLDQSVVPDTVFKRDKYGIYVNDSINIGAFGITPGLRYDHSTIGGGLLSPSVGMTYLISKDVLLRAVVSRGFHDPKIDDSVDQPGVAGNPDLEPEKIWSYELGAEANLYNILWAKLTVFYHDIKDLISDKDLGNGDITRVNIGKVKSTGAEVEISTKEYKGFKAKAGFHYERQSFEHFDDERIFDPTRAFGFNTAVAYNDQKGLSAILQGHYMWWNYPPFWEANYNGFIMDFNLTKRLLKKEATELEVFFTAHNLLNASSFANSLVQNPGRWIEAGVRYSF